MNAAAVMQEESVIPSQPHRPAKFTFPKAFLGLEAPVPHSFQPSWFKHWPFFIVMTHLPSLLQGHRLKAANADPAFLSPLD